MNPHQFVKVFDIRDTSLLDWTSSTGLILVPIGIAIAVVPAIFPEILTLKDIPFLRLQALQSRLFRYGFASFAILMTAVVFANIYPLYQRRRALVEHNDCRVVEGPVEYFTPMPYPGGHGALESFSVAGVPFKYSEYVTTVGFNHTASHGGPITSDSYVRICYDPSGSVILRLEIRDFGGDMPSRRSDRLK